MATQEKSGRSENEAGPGRYTTTPFPTYRFRPGSTPHPIRDPDGHSHDKDTDAVSMDPLAWQRCEPYLFAIDLFNHRYYWEAHEELEAIWNGAGRTSRIARFVQGLIQAAAACLKAELGSPGPAGRLAEAACEKLADPPAGALGIDVPELVRGLRDHVGGAGAGPPVIHLSR